MMKKIIKKLQSEKIKKKKFIVNLNLNTFLEVVKRRLIE